LIGKKGDGRSAIVLFCDIKSSGIGIIATAKAIMTVGAKHSGGKSLSKTHKLSALTFALTFALTPDS